MKPFDKKNMEIAVKAAISNPVEKLPRMAALIAKKGSVMSMGLNSYKSHPLQKRFAENEHKMHCHAEIAAIKNFLRDNKASDLKGTTLYVARVWKNDQEALAKPCAGCQSAITEFEINRVFWTQ